MKKLTPAEEHLCCTLNEYQPFDQVEIAAKASALNFLRSTPNCFFRNCQLGHFVGGAWLLNSHKDKVLFTHHKKYNRWLQLGGHADGQADLEKVAEREAREESGIKEIKLLSKNIFDIDIHHVPADVKRGEPAHLHYELRYLFIASSEDFHISSESNSLNWFTLPELKAQTFSESINRMLKKWENYLQVEKWANS